MRYVVVGAGAIGGVLAARLARSSSAHPPLLIARGHNAEAIREHGLHLRTPDEDVHVAVAVASSPGQVTLREDDVLVFATKTQHVRSALLDWTDRPVQDPAGHVTGKAGEVLPVLMALNGVESERIALRLFRRVFGVCVWLPAAHLAPGELLSPLTAVHGVFLVGRHPASDETAADALLSRTLTADWEAAGFQVHAVESIMPWKYAKLLMNLGNAVEALVGPGTDATDILAQLRAEGRAVLAEAGIPVTPDHLVQAWRGGLFGNYRPIPGVEGALGSSSWQSMARGTGDIETDYLNGEIVLIARSAGRDAPLNAAVQAAARRAATAHRGPGSMTLEDLRQVIRMARRAA